MVKTSLVLASTAILVSGGHAYLTEKEKRLCHEAVLSLAMSTNEAHVEQILSDPQGDLAVCKEFFNYILENQ